MSAVKIGKLFKDFSTSLMRDQFNKNPDVFMLNFLNVKSAEMSLLRKELGGVGAGMFVVKNSFCRHLMKDLNKSGEAIGFIDGPVSLVFSQDDPVATLKVLVGFAKTHTALKLRGGMLSDRVISPAEIKTLAQLSSQQAVYQQVASVLNAPLCKLAMGLNQIVAKLVYALKAVGDQKK